MKKRVIGALGAALTTAAVTLAAPAGAAHADNSCGYASTVGYTCYYYYYNATISEGSGNAAAVKEIQDIINVHTDYPVWLTVDGSFGPNTVAAVEWLQKHHGIAGGVDGIVGAHTWAFLRS